MEVLFAENGREGIEALQSAGDVDLVLMDVMMPEMDGYETTQAIRQLPEFEKLPIIALTAKAMKGDRETLDRGRRLRLHHEAGRHRPASLPDARVALPVETRSTAGEAELELEQLELELLLEGIYRRYGFDFREYAPASLKRRLRRRMDGEKVRDGLRAPGSDPARPGRDGTAPARPLGQRDRDVPRSILLRRLPREGRPGAAHAIPSPGSGSPAARPARRSTRSRSCWPRKASPTACASTRPTSTRP